MLLLGTDKIVRYIGQEPDARLSLLTFIKEFPYRQHFSGGKEESANAISTAVALPDLGVYGVEYRINAGAGTFFITRVDKVEMFQAAVDPLLAKTAEVEIVPPAPFDGEKHEVTAKEMPVSMPDAEFDSGFKYEDALARVEQLFDAVQGTAEFSALIELLPGVAAYEAKYLQFPTFTPAEIVKHRMKMFHMDARYLSSVLHDKYDIQSFLDGSLKLPNEDLDRLYNLVGYKFPAADARFIAE